MRQLLQQTNNSAESQISDSVELTMGYQCCDIDNHREAYLDHYTLYHGVRLRQRVHAVVLSRNQAVKWNAWL